MEKAIASTVDDVKPNVSSRDDRIVSSNDLHDSARERVIIYSCAVLSCISFGFMTRFYDFLIEIDWWFQIFFGWIRRQSQFVNGIWVKKIHTGPAKQKERLTKNVNQKHRVKLVAKAAMVEMVEMVVMAGMVAKDDVVQLVHHQVSTSSSQ